MAGPCNGVEQAVSQLCAFKGVFLLRFHGHGGPGVASSGSGHGELDTSMKERSDIWSDPTIIAIVGRLRSIFGPYGCVEFIECETGKGHAGKRLLSQLASKLGVPVTGAVLDQPFSKRTTFRLDGPTVTVMPGGVSLANWCKSLPAFAGMSVA